VPTVSNQTRKQNSFLVSANQAKQEGEAVMIRILYINDDPAQLLLEEAFEKAGIEVEITVAERIRVAKSYFQEGRVFDAVFMDFKLDCGETAISSGLVKLCLEKGFGEGKKPLIAYSQGHNDQLMAVGCSHSCRWFDLDELVCKFFTV
jgi:NAD(P)H-flavin reductase